MDADKKNKFLSVFIRVHLWLIFLFLLRRHKQPRCVLFVEFEEEDHAAGFGGEGLGAAFDVSAHSFERKSREESGHNDERI